MSERLGMGRPGRGSCWVFMQILHLDISPSRSGGLESKQIRSSYITYMKYHISQAQSVDYVTSFKTPQGL